VPDPAWPVPPRGWQLWAAAGPDSIDDASFTLPARPAVLLEAEPVDLLAVTGRGRLPEGAVSGFAVLAALLLFSLLVGGMTGALVVMGVSTLLAASAALIHGRLSLARVGGQRGAGVLLGGAVLALITGSMVTAGPRPGPAQLRGAPFPVSSAIAGSDTAYAAVPLSQRAGPSPSGSVTEAVTGGGRQAPIQPPDPKRAPEASLAPALTLSPDALAPGRSATAAGVGTPKHANRSNASRTGRGAGKAAEVAGIAEVARVAGAAEGRDPARKPQAARTSEPAKSSKPVTSSQPAASSRPAEASEPLRKPLKGSSASKVLTAPKGAAPGPGHPVRQ
jgi:hypothetical protein